MAVIDFNAKKTEREPHRSGTARCLNCKHEWEAVARAGTVSLTCPECSTFQGVFRGLSSTEMPQWQCICGEWTFFVDQQGCYCAHCGLRPRW